MGDPMIQPPKPPPGPMVARKAVAPLRTLASLAGGRFLPEHIKLIAGLNKDMVVTVTDEDRKHATKPFWFRYFWNEAVAKPLMFEPHAAAFAVFFERMFVLPQMWDPAHASCELKLQGNLLLYRTGSAANPFQTLTPKANNWSTVSDADLLNILELLLGIGFESCIPKGSEARPFSKKEFLDSSLDVLRQGLVGEFDKAYFLGWRGDGRDVGKIRDTGGLINKSQSDYQGYAASQNMRAAWNPFSLPANQSKWFYRIAQDDNCLQSVVSVSTDFRSSCTFPLLNGDYVVLAPLAPTEAQLKLMSESDVKKWSRITGEVAGVPKTVIRFADRQQLYLVVVDTQYFDTRERQPDKFPEVAVKRIPTDNILACISFVRVHHKTVENQPLTALFDARGSTPPSIDHCRRYCQSQKFAKILFDHVQKLYNDTVAALGPNFNVCWASNGAVNAAAFMDDSGQPMRIRAVKNTFGGTLWQG